MSSNAVVDFMVEISGGRVLRDTLDQLASKEVRRAARKAVTAGMSVMTRALRAAAPEAETPGHSGKNLPRAIKGRHQRGKAGQVAVKVGIGVGAQGAGKSKYSKAKGNLARAPHLHLIALGTENRYTGARSYTRSGKTTRTRKDGSTYTLGRHSRGKVSIITGNKKMFRGRMFENKFIPQTAGRLNSALQVHMADVFVHEIEMATRRLSHVSRS